MVLHVHLVHHRCEGLLARLPLPCLSVGFVLVVSSPLLDDDSCVCVWSPYVQGKLYIITEYAANGNLHDYIKKQKTRLSEDLIWKLFVQVRVCVTHV